jgi:hypothetical protein
MTDAPDSRHEFTPQAGSNLCVCGFPRSAPEHDADWVRAFTMERLHELFIIARADNRGLDALALMDARNSLEVLGNLVPLIRAAYDEWKAKVHDVQPPKVWRDIFDAVGLEAIEGRLTRAEDGSDG